MSDWQPARFVQVHAIPFENIKALQFAKENIIHIQEADPATLLDISVLRRGGCLSEKFFWVKEAPGFYVCECEILTD